MNLILAHRAHQLKTRNILRCLPKLRMMLFGIGL
jgi:hypothetical protein